MLYIYIYIYLKKERKKKHLSERSAGPARLHRRFLGDFDEGIAHLTGKEGGKKKKDTNAGPVSLGLVFFCFGGFFDFLFVFLFGFCLVLGCFWGV